MLWPLSLVLVLFSPVLFATDTELDYVASTQNPASEWGTEVGSEPLLEDNTGTANDGDTSYVSTTTSNALYYGDVVDFSLPAGDIVSAVRVYVVVKNLGDEVINIGLRNNGTDSLSGASWSNAQGTFTPAAGYTEYWEEWTSAPGGTWDVNSLMFHVKYTKNGGTSSGVRMTAGRLVVTHAPAPTTTAQASGDWGTAGTWDNGVPTSSNKAVIPTGFTVTITTGSPTCSELVVSGGTLTTNAGGGTVTLTIASTNGITLSGGSITLNRKELISSAGPISISNGTTFTIGDGTSTAAVSASGQAITCAGNIVINTTEMANALVCGTFAATAGTVTVTDGLFSVPNSGTLYNVSIGAAGELKPLASGNSFSVLNNFTKTGTFTHNNGTVTFNSSAAQTITGAVTFYNLTIDNTHGTPNDTNDVESTAATTVTNTLNVNDGQLPDRSLKM